MKIFKCPDCKDVRKKEDNVIMVRCGCGGKMEEVDFKHNSIDKRNKVEKICDSNECANCPARGDKCFGALDALTKEKTHDVLYQNCE